MIRVLVTGANGQLGKELLRARWALDVEVIGLTFAHLDITDRAAVHTAVKDVEPAVIVNAAAYTAVDRAEDEEERATAVNATGVGFLAEAANLAGAQLVHVSSDYVFDGSKDGWYVETDLRAPLGAYGRSKAAGEDAAATANNSVTLRTAWVYGALGSNFVTTMLRLAQERDELGVVDDQIGCPTAAADIATAIVELVEASGHGRDRVPRRLYHLASPEQASWHEFAVGVFEASVAGFDGVCHRLSTAEYPTRAVRPANSRLDSARIEDDLGIIVPSWHESLPLVVAELESAATGARR